MNNLTKPKSSPVTNTFPFFDLSTLLISVPSEQGGNIPYTGHPKTHVHEDHFSSLLFEAPLVSYFPVFASQNKISYEVQLLIRTFESTEKSKWVIVE